MKQSYKNWLIEKDDFHIVTLYLNIPDTSTNVLSQEVLIELQTILDEMKKMPLKALIFQSSKEHCFIAGADVNEFSKFIESNNAYDEALHAIQIGQHVMNSIENLPYPTFSLINGHCLGGGMELALACDYRIALDDSQTRIGLPEVKLGIHPGFGGTVRMNRLLGVFKAMNLMLSGRILSVEKAQRFGLIDNIISNKIKNHHFRDLVNQWIDESLSQKKGILKYFTQKHKRPFYNNLLELNFIRPFVSYLISNKVSKRVKKHHYPAPFELINLWQLHAGNDDFMMKKEAESVACLITSETAQNLIRIFHLQNKLKNLTHSSTDKKIKHIHIIGGGVMGGDIAIWCVYKGLTVTVHDQNNEVLARLVKRASDFFNRKFKEKHQFQSALDRLIPDINNDGLKKANLIIEAIIENVEAKQSVFKQAENIAHPDCIFATNTSSIPLDDISHGLSDPGRLVGIHFFNPVSRMPLIEIVSSNLTSETAKKMAMQFSGQLGKLPLPVRSTPGFLVNRVLTPYLLEAMELYTEGVPATFIDQAALNFGMPMGPIELSDKVGLDICLSVAENLSKSQNVSVPETLVQWVKKGHLGIKTNQGFYEYKKGKPIKNKTDYTGLTLTQVSNRLMFRLFNEAVACLDEHVVENEDFLDAGIIFGTGFAPFLGGPMHYIKHQGIAEMDHKLIDLSKNFGQRFNPGLGWNTFISMH
ncbi:MAG: 3-hydroxyacyl-CoA dehydrogenase NAD-binding domain-containing protein [Gammaproteobacteria bacterium]|nr:3-hydroxyacyl-CoA dehydrogenase NAD-binding domain-containing protein [Gammaproteobacteria bacterium]